MLRRETPVMLSNFSLGLITKVKELNGMDKRGTPDCMDVYADLDGSLHKREGSTKLNSTAAGAGSYDCHGLFDFEGTLIGSFGTSYLKMDELDGTWDALTGGTGMSDEAIECEDYSGNLFICNWGGDYIKTMQLGGSTLTNLNTTSVGGRGKHPKVYKDHLLVSGVPGYPYTFFYTAAADIDNFADGGTWPVLTHDGDTLTGWGDLSGKLFAFKRWSIHQITFLGGSPYWKNTQITKGIGTRSPKTIKNVTLKDGSEVLMFLGSNRKIYQFNGYNASAVSDNFEESNNICPISMLTLNQGALENAHAVVDTTNHWYILYAANGGATSITHGIIYNYYTGACWPFSNQVYGASIDAVDGNGKKWIIVGNYNGYALRWNYGTQDWGAISTVASAPTAGGTAYTTGDILTVVGGMGGTVSVVASAGIVTAVTLVTGGVGYATGTGQSTVGGTGSGCTVNISAVTTAPISAYHTTPRLILSPEILAEVFQVSVSMKAISDDTVNFYHRQDYKDAWSTAETIPLGNAGEEYYLGTTFALGTATLGPAEVVKTKIVGLDVQGNSIQFKISDSLTTGPWTLYAYGLIGRKLGLDRQEKP